MSLLSGLNYSTNVEGEMGDFAEPLSTGQYAMIIMGWSEAETQERDIRVNLEFAVIDGEFKNRKLTERLTAFSSKPNSNAGMFFQRFMKGLARAVGLPAGLKIDDVMLNQLVHKRVLVDIRKEDGRPKPGGGAYPARNRFDKFHPASGAASTPAPQQTMMQQPPFEYAPPQPQYAPQGMPQGMPQGYAPQPSQAPQGFVMPPQAPQQQPPAGYAGAAPTPYSPPPMQMPPQATAGAMPSWMGAGASA